MSDRVHASEETDKVERNNRTQPNCTKETNGDGNDRTSVSSGVKEELERTGLKREDITDRTNYRTRTKIGYASVFTELTCTGRQTKVRGAHHSFLLSYSLIYNNNNSNNNINNNNNNTPFMLVNTTCRLHTNYSDAYPSQR